MNPERFLMTPGPTTVPKRVRDRMAAPIRNPDVDPSFVDWYRRLTEKLAQVFETDDDVVVLGGEAILGLEAAVASLIGPGDEVLCVSNGIYGDGFADFVELYGGEAVVCGVAFTEPLDVEGVKALVEEREFAAATMVHCETPTGVLNDLDEVLGILTNADVITIVDAVSSVGGTAVPVDDVDVCIGGSQKCLSSPPGLTPIAIGDSAWDAIEDGESRAFYADLTPWRTVIEEGWFPYTHLAANLAALDESVDLLLEEGIESVFERHEAVAMHCRERVFELGLDLYGGNATQRSPTVTALDVSGEASGIQRKLHEEHGILVATGLPDMVDDVLRIGHMGYNADRSKVDRTMDALTTVLEG